MRKAWERDYMKCEDRRCRICWPDAPRGELFWTDREVMRVPWGTWYVDHAILGPLAAWNSGVASCDVLMEYTGYRICRTLLLRPYHNPYGLACGLCPCGKVFFFAQEKCFDSASN